MSGGRLIFTFKNGLGFALNKEKIEEGAVIEFDLNFEQVDMEYDSAAFTMINQEEFRQQKPVLKFKNKSPQSSEKKRKLDVAESSDAANKIKSMVMTTRGELVGATPTGDQPEGKATLTRTQKRNRNRRLHKMMEQLREQGEDDTVLDQVVNTLKEKPVEVLPQSTKTIEKIVHKEKVEEKNEEIEPYVPQYVDRPRRLQIIPGHELEKFERMKKKDDFRHFQWFQGEYINVLEGLELFTNVFSEREQREIVDCVRDERNLGRAGRLRRRSYSEPAKWKRGKGRVTIQYGCCYNFAEDREGNPPGIIRHDEVDPLPSFVKMMVKRMVSWKVLPVDCIPNSCIVNIYKEGDCIPPHTDHQDFMRPFCTVSFINKCNIMFGTQIRIIGDGEFDGPVEIPLPVGSVLIFKGNGADIAKHCIPGVSYERISITLRRMHEDKIPFRFRPDFELESLQPYDL